MVDVSHKPTTARRAVASARLRTRQDVVQRIAQGAMQKGDVLAVARVAGIMAAKRTADLIPLCHPLPLSKVELAFKLGKAEVAVSATVSTCSQTGVEMEALTAVSVAALTLYDMCKAVDPAMAIDKIFLQEKHGGQSGSFVRAVDCENQSTAERDE